MRMSFLAAACGAGSLAMSAMAIPADTPSGTPPVTPPASAAKRPLDVNDFDRLQSVESLGCSKDWIVYTVEGSDLASDERKSSVWMTDFEGGNDLRLTAAGESASNPKFSPDGRYVSFLSARKADDKSDLYLLDRRGGEAQPLAGISGDVADYAWSPDGTRLVISMSGDGTAKESDKPKVPKPIVIDRLHFKEDRTGYLTADERTQLYLFDLSTKSLSALTNDRDADATAPVFSPDGRHIAFFSNRTTDADRTGKLELDLIEAKAGASRQAGGVLCTQQADPPVDAGWQAAHLHHGTRGASERLHPGPTECAQHRGRPDEGGYGAARPCAGSSRRGGRWHGRCDRRG
jgi:dipeptidyl aminopeptidase/acylaminoacyl peptidase